MAILLGCDGVHLEFPTKLVAQDVTLGVNEGDRIGIVGKNGDGKSSLLGILSGAIEPDSGRVTHRRDVRVGVLGQCDSLDDASTVHRAVVGDLPEYEWASSPRVRQILDACARPRSRSSSRGWSPSTPPTSRRSRRSRRPSPPPEASSTSSRWLGSRPASSSRANACNVLASSCLM